MNWIEGQTHAAKPPTGERRLQFPSHCHPIPRRHIHGRVPPPDEQNAESVDDRDQEHLRQHGIAQAHRRGDGRVKPPARLVGHQAALHKRPHHEAHPLVDHQFRHDEQWKREQEPGMHVHVEKERHLDAIAPRVSFGDRQSQQRQPRNECQGDHTTPHQVRHIAAKMRTPQELKERSAEDQREIR